MNLRISIVLLTVLISLAAAQTVVQTLDAPDTNISGLTIGGGSLWACDNVTNMVYKLDAATGAVQLSWYVATTGGTAHPAGMGFGNNQVYVALTTGYVNYYNTSGAYLGQFSALC
jgi:hypothetical protein